MFEKVTASPEASVSASFTSARAWISTFQKARRSRRRWVTGSTRRAPRSPRLPIMFKHNFRKPLLNTEIRRRGIYLLPNIFTTAALIAGFYAIVQAMDHHFDDAAKAIFVAMILDTLDGRVARLTHTQSAFGAEYDSLSDMVCFGAAPALVMYEWALQDLGRFGWIAAFVYCAGAALRLARFNTQLSVADKRWFQGLPSPAPAGLRAGMIWVFNDYQVAGGEVKWYAAALTVYAGITMVSNVKFYSG